MIENLGIAYKMLNPRDRNAPELWDILQEACYTYFKAHSRRSESPYAVVFLKFFTSRCGSTNCQTVVLVFLKISKYNEDYCIMLIRLWTTFHWTADTQQGLYLLTAETASRQSEIYADRLSPAVRLPIHYVVII